ncbi:MULTISPECIES: site-specific integrase [unclassified Paenibacillus]|uniref:site-specific integrase n=1 Tax=unclassified Paenibacillus TaxID=185978 RepID=UPI00240556C5|nr:MULTISPECIES: site-specific integrase [unclassified Paenibacillus]MDF9839068.1 integrase [Paenibacillus sp. PastF-2]MDF9845650.1 integrase [Paenibacillus sp. PastM-2]MDF9852222.1 integrase [Paenibacillus sp. PastF-1]MDH6478049.1 integrase [Paenibacillus sp. PastH-2]MDH6505784.1 integrase [Paenibacillus sp. PastM-3]
MRGCVSKRGNKWCYVVEYGRHPETGKRRQKSKSGFATKVEAEKALSKVLHEMNTDTFIETTKDDVTTFITTWLAQKKMTIRPGTYKTYRWLVNYHIIPQLGQLKVANLLPQHLVSMYERMQGGEKKLSPQTINHVHKVLHDALKTAVQWGLLTRNVSELVKPPKIPKAETKVWNEEELMEFLEFTKDSRYYIIFLLAATTGMRRGEVLALRWEDVDLKAGKVTVRRSYTRGVVGHIFQEPKTKAGIRSIVLPQQTTDALKKQRLLLEDDRKKATKKGTEYNDYGLVAQTKNGYPVNPYYLESRWLDFIRNSGLPRIRFHDLRHTHASLLLKAGVHPKVVTERLGHSSITITLDRYSHLFPTMQQEAAEKLDDLMKAADKSSIPIPVAVHQSDGFLLQ